MKNLVFILMVIILMIGCSESVTGPDNPDESKLDIPELIEPVLNEYIDGDTIKLDWSSITDKETEDGEIEICGYFKCVSWDSVFVVNYDPPNNQVHDTVSFGFIEGSSGSIWIPASWCKIFIDSTDYAELGDTIKIFWKIKARASSVMESGNWSNIESFHVVNAEI